MQKKNSLVAHLIIGALVIGNGLGFKGKTASKELTKEENKERVAKAEEKRNRKKLKKLKDMGYHTEEGLIFHEGNLLSVLAADCLARGCEFQYAEQLVKFMEANK